MSDSVDINLNIQQENIDVNLSVQNENVDISLSVQQEVVDIVSTPSVTTVNVTSSASINPSLYDLSQFTNVTSNKFIRESNLSSYVPANRTITINGVTLSLSSNRSWDVGTVTSVGLVMPTGFTSTNAITTSGEITIGFASGYSLPSNNSQANWESAYNNMIVSGAVTGTTTKTLTLTQQDGGTVVASWSDYDTAPVTSVFGRLGDIIAEAGDYSTTLVTEGTNLYFTDSRARASLSSSATGLTYNTTTGVFSLTSGYSIPTTANQSNWTTAYNRSLTAVSINYDTFSTNLILTEQDSSTLSLSLIAGAAVQGKIVFFNGSNLAYTSLNASAPLSLNPNNFTFSISQAGASTDGYLSTADWNTFNNKQNGITLTTIGNSGSATFLSDTLNIPTYTLSGLGGTPSTRTLEINGTSYDLSTDRSWSVGTVTSIGISVPTGLTVSNTPITTNGVIAIELNSDYSIPTIADQTNWLTAYSWGDHSLEGYLTVETDPIFSASPSFGITNTDITNWNTAYSWGNHATQNYATTTYVDTAVNNLIDSAPGTLDTLNELAAALGDDPNFATTVATSIGTKVPLTRTLTINGTAYDLSADRSWTILDSYIQSVQLDGTLLRFGGVNSAFHGNIDLSALGYLTSFTETDPTVPAHVKSITTTEKSNWNTAYSWGNHAGLYSLLGHTHTFASITSKPTTIAGYDITDAYTDAEIRNFFSGTDSITGYNKSNWDTAYSWGNHASVGYLTSFTETDPTVPSHVKGITTADILNWNTAFSWGDHGVEGYATQTWVQAQGYLTAETDSQILSWSASDLGLAISNGNTITLTGLATETYVNSQGFLTSFTETDPTVPSHVKGITTTNISNWNTAYGWGNHASVGYLTSFTETDPTVPSHVKGITTTNISNWDTAFSWGDHSTRGYATETYVNTAVSNLIDSAPGTLDTLNELAAALGDDPNFATTITTLIGTKQNQLNGTGFVKVSGTTVSYDNSTYLTTSAAASTYALIGHTHPMSDISGLQTALDGKFDDPTGTIDQYIDGTGALQTFPTTLPAQFVRHQVKAGVAINKGQAVYVTSADGTNMIVGLASNATEATSSKTMGLLDATVSANDFANVVTEGLLAGLDTTGANAGDPVWLGTGGNLIFGLANKPYAPRHLVFIGIVTRVNANNGEIFVKVQNGFELDELHDVDLKTSAPTPGQLLRRDSDGLWKNWTPNYLTSFTETDPIYTASSWYSTTNNSANWNTAYGWGDHSTIGYQLAATAITTSNIGSQSVNYANSAGALSNNNDYFVLRSGGTGSSIDTYTDNGFRALGYSGYSSQLWSANTGGSTGTVQLEFEYNTPTRGFKVRNKTDNNSWSPTGWVVMTTSNQGHISGTIATQSWVQSQGYLTAETDSQTLSWSASDKSLSISNGNSVTLTGLATESFVTGQGYITGYTEVDTLATVTARGASTGVRITLNDGLILGPGKPINFSGWGESHSFYVEDIGAAGNGATRMIFQAADDFTYNQGWEFRSVRYDSVTTSRFYIPGDGSLPTVDGNAISTQAWVNSQGYIVTGSTVPVAASWSNATKFKSTGDISQSSAGNHSLQVFADLNNDAFMAFHISSDYAVYFGLENATNRLYTGGWSDGNSKYQIWDSRDFTSTNISNWNTAYGWGDHSTRDYATTTYVNTRINDLINGAPGALDTLDELAAALGDDANFASTVTNSIATKLPLAGGTMSGTIVLASISGTDQMVENTYGNYLHLGGWGVDRTHASAVLVNTAYRSDYADSLFDMRISRFTNDTGYITSSGSISGNAATATYATSSGNADTLDSYHETAFVRLSPNSSTPTNGMFAIGTAGGRNFIQSHAGRPLDINPEGNAVAVGSDMTVSGNVTAAKLGVGGSINTSFDLYNNGTSYFNGRTYFDDQIDISSSYSLNFGTSRLHSTDTSYFLGGNVGIGTSTPQVSLDVNGHIGIVGSNYLYFGHSTTNIGAWTTRIYASGSTQKFNAQTFIFNNEGYGSVEYMAITANGINLRTKNTIDSTDSWLRLNQSGDYTSGVYTPYVLKNDGEFINYGGIYGYNGVRGRKAQTDNNYTTAALWTESYDNTTTGVAFHISGNYGAFLEMRTNRVLYWDNNTVWHSGNLTNLNQLANGPGYITGYTETDTLASVCGRGASTSTQIYINNNNPTLYLQDTDNRSAMIHVNSDYFYILNGSGNNSTSWAEQANGRWLFMGNLNNNDITFGGGGDFARDLMVRGTITEQSARRFKENIKPLESSLDKVNNLNPVTYNKIGSEDLEIGLVAEEVAELFPEVVTYTEDGETLGIQYQRLSVILLKAVQDLTARIEKLENK